MHNTPIFERLKADKGAGNTLDFGRISRETLAALYREVADAHIASLFDVDVKTVRSRRVRWGIKLHETPKWPTEEQKRHVDEAALGCMNIALDSALPMWLFGWQQSGSIWWHTNEHGDPWAARRYGDSLVVSGRRIGWERICLDIQTAEGELGRASQFESLHPFSSTGATATRDGCGTKFATHDGWELSTCEALWYLAVLIAALPMMRRSEVLAPAQ